MKNVGYDIRKSIKTVSLLLLVVGNKNEQKMQWLNCLVNRASAYCLPSNASNIFSATVLFERIKDDLCIIFQSRLLLGCLISLK